MDGRLSPAASLLRAPYGANNERMAIHCRQPSRCPEDVLSQTSGNLLVIGDVLLIYPSPQQCTGTVFNNNN